MKLTLGTVQFGLNYGIANVGGRVCLEDARAIVKRAHQVGMDTMDTAIAYGESELILGQIGVESWNVVTKLPTIPHDCKNVAQWVNNQITESCKRLQLNRVYGLMLHQPSQLHERSGSELYGALQSVKKEGLVEKIGVSVYGSAELEALYEQYAIDLVQAPLNILDRSLVDSGWAQRLKNSGIEVHTRSAFLQGLLLMPKEKRPSKFDRWQDVWIEWDRWLAISGLTPLQACLRYTNSVDCIDRLVVGVDNVAQLDEIIEAAEGELPSLPQFNTLQDTRLVNPSKWNQL